MAKTPWTVGIISKFGSRAFEDMLAAHGLDRSIRDGAAELTNGIKASITKKLNKMFPNGLTGGLTTKDLKDHTTPGEMALLKKDFMADEANRAKYNDYKLKKYAREHTRGYGRNAEGEVSFNIDKNANRHVEMDAQTDKYVSKDQYQEIDSRYRKADRQRRYAASQGNDDGALEFENQRIAAENDLNEVGSAGREKRQAQLRREKLGNEHGGFGAYNDNMDEFSGMTKKEKFEAWKKAKEERGGYGDLSDTRDITYDDNGNEIERKIVQDHERRIHHDANGRTVHEEAGNGRTEMLVEGRDYTYDGTHKVHMKDDEGNLLYLKNKDGTYKVDDKGQLIPKERYEYESTAGNAGWENREDWDGRTIHHYAEDPKYNRRLREAEASVALQKNMTLKEIERADKAHERELKHSTRWTIGGRTKDHNAAAIEDGYDIIKDPAELKALENKYGRGITPEDRAFYEMYDKGNGFGSSVVQFAKNHPLMVAGAIAVTGVGALGLMSRGRDDD